MDDFPVVVVSVEFPADTDDQGLRDLIAELDRHFDRLEGVCPRVRQSPSQRYLAMQRMRRACR